MNWRCWLGFHKDHVLERPVPWELGEKALCQCDRCLLVTEQMTLASDHLTKRWEGQR